MPRPHVGYPTYLHFISYFSDCLAQPPIHNFMIACMITATKDARKKITVELRGLGREYEESSPVPGRGACFFCGPVSSTILLIQASVLWTLCQIIHATIKWLAGPWATYSPPKRSEDDDFGSKHVWVRIATKCFNIVVLVGFVTAMAAGGWLSAKILGKFGIEKNAEGPWERPLTGPAAGEETPLREEELWREGEVLQINPGAPK